LDFLPDDRPTLSEPAEVNFAAGKSFCKTLKTFVEVLTADRMERVSFVPPASSGIEYRILDSGILVMASRNFLRFHFLTEAQNQICRRRKVPSPTSCAGKTAMKAIATPPG